MPVWIGLIALLRFEFNVSLFFIFLFFQCVWTITVLFMHMDSLCRRQSAQFTGPNNHFIQKKILKMGPTVLFTHSKIILLRYFQFSVFRKKNCIRTDPTHVKFCDNRILFTIWCINLILIRNFKLQKLAI